jgi:hypothetical protein
LFSKKLRIILLFLAVTVAPFGPVESSFVQSGASNPFAPHNHTSPNPFAPDIHLPPRLSGPSEHEPSTGGVICRNNEIQGFGTPAGRAEEFIGTNTTDIPSEMRVFVTTYDGHLYMHSNFVTPGFDGHPTKFATHVSSDTHVMAIAYNMISPDAEAVPVSVYPNIAFFVDDKVFADSTFKNLDFGGSPKVYVIGTDDIVRPSAELDASGGANTRIVEFAPNLYGRAGAYKVAETFQRLESAPFYKTKIRLLSLVRNSDTEDVLASKIPKDVLLSPDDLSLAGVIAAFKQNSGKSIFILGHVEDDSFVVRNASGKEIARVKISQLLSAAAENDVLLFPLGCNSAKLSRAGVATQFNSIDAVKRFSQALSSATNWKSFYQTLATPNLILVLDNSILSKTDPSTATFKVIYHETARGTEQVRWNVVGTVGHGFAPSPPPPCAAPCWFGPDDDGFPWAFIIFFGGLGALVIWGVIARARQSA